MSYYEYLKFKVTADPEFNRLLKNRTHKNILLLTLRTVLYSHKVRLG